MRVVHDNYNTTLVSFDTKFIRLDTRTTEFLGQATRFLPVFLTLADIDFKRHGFWLCAAGLFLCCVHFVALLLCLMDPAWHCGQLVEEEGVGTLLSVGLWRVYYLLGFVCSSSWCHW